MPLPDDFHAVDESGDRHDIRSLMNASPEFVLAMSEEAMQFKCPCPDCHEGQHLSPVYGKIRLLGLEFTGITGIKSDGPCETCAGMGWVYGVCPN